MDPTSNKTPADASPAQLSSPPPHQRIKEIQRAPRSPPSPLNTSTSSSTDSGQSLPIPDETGRLPATFYAGIPSRPKLLASTRPAAQLAHLESDYGIIPKRIYPISPRHKICALWEATIVPHIADLISALYPTGTVCLDLVEIGHTEEDAIATIWIGLRAGAISYETAARMAEATKEFCMGKGAGQFEIDVRDTCVQKLTKLLDPGSILPDLHKHADPWCHTLGTPISTAKYPNAIGTGGLMVRLPNQEKLFMLSAHHVVELDHRSRLEPTQEDKRTLVRLQTPASFKNIQEELAKQIAVQTTFVNGIKGAIEQAELSGRDPTFLRQKHNRTEVPLNDLIDWSKRLNTNFSDTDQRTFGQTYAYPPIAYDVATGNSDHDRANNFSEDWCLIETDIELGTEPINVLNFGDIGELLFAKRRPDRLPALSVEMELSQMLKINGFLSQADLATKSIAVIKRGFGTELTLGMTNCVHSYWRHDIAWSKELAIINLDDNGERGTDSKAFSAHGDSGATVIDRQGRICGLLHAGCLAGEKVVQGPDGSKLRAPMDITYVTPWWWLKGRMRDFGLEPTVV